MVSAKTQAILLLTAHFSKAGKSDAKPLSNKEWGRFAFWLKNQGLFPEDLLNGDIDQKLAGWVDGKITVDRIQALLNRGSALAVAMEKWTRAGLWVLTRSDPEYPKRFKARLGNDAPPVFFGCGNRSILTKGGIAVIGSRKTSDADLEYSRRLGGIAAQEGQSIVSGGARGVDEAAMLGALGAEGTAVGILSNELLRAATSAKYRKHLMANNLVLLSPFYPEAGFHAGNAMQRNKYIYCLSDTAIAVHSGTSGGTWTGALENIKHGWVPMWVKPTDDPDAGNETLVQKGARWLPDDIRDIDFNFLQSYANPAAETEQDVDMFAETQPEPTLDPVSNVPVSGGETDTTAAVTEKIEELAAPEAIEAPQTEAIEPVKPQEHADGVARLSLYDYFLWLLEQEVTSPKTVEELLEITQLHRTQLNTWLKQAVAEDVVTKFAKPVRYQWTRGKQRTIFEEN
jgi:predicted Rossmann fold nucleotide-binding protein DprA/Smf involved in DNA uptake